MNDRLGDRTVSVSSSVTEAEGYDESEKKGSHDGSFVKVKSPEEMEMGSDIERAELLPPVQAEKVADPASSNKAAVIWMVVNTLATIGIVCIFHKSNRA
jgi:solute carrier family 35 protein E3